MKLLNNILTRLGIRKGQDPETMAEVYNNNGVRLFAPKNILGLKTLRRLALVEALNDSSLGVNTDDLTAFVTLVKEYGNKGDMASIMQAAGILGFYIEQHAQLTNVKRIANILLFLPGEDPQKLESKYMKLKADLFETDPEFRGFFLTGALQILGDLSTVSIKSSEVEAYFKNPTVKTSEELFSKLITKNDEPILEKK